MAATSSKNHFTTPHCPRKNRARSVRTQRKRLPPAGGSLKPMKQIHCPSSPSTSSFRAGRDNAFEVGECTRKLSATTCFQLTVWISATKKFLWYHKNFWPAPGPWTKHWPRPNQHVQNFRQTLLISETFLTSLHRISFKTQDRWSPAH